MARVFISYASADRECAGQLYEWLAAEDHEVFLDQDPGNGIAVGEEWLRHEALCRIPYRIGRDLEEYLWV